MSRHTSGPWSVNAWRSKEYPDIQIGAIGTPLIATIHFRDVSVNELEANANLITAAPEFFKALQRLLLTQKQGMTN